MSSPYMDWKRDGLTRLVALARALCALVTTFGHIIRSKYASNVAIIALLTAAETLCAALPGAIAEFDAISSEDPLPPSDPSGLPGINPEAPEPPELETPE